jgi:UDP-glucuronate 4-epimerase
MNSVLVTGSSGFIGLALGEALLSRGVKVVGVDLEPPPPGALKRYGELSGEFVHVKSDVGSNTVMAEAISAHNVDRIVALAAITADIDRERRAARSVIEVNVGGTIATLEAARATGVKQVIYIGSGSAYGAAGYDEPLLVEEKTPSRPESLYGISKLAAEQTALRLGDVFELDVRVGRLGTCFGPWEYATSARDTPSAVFQIVQNFRSGKPVSLPRPHPKDWLYSRDAAQAIISLLEADATAPRICNLAAGFIWSLEDLCKLLQEEDEGFAWNTAPEAAPTINLYGPRDRAPMDCTRIRDLGFAPRYDLQPAIRDYLDWLERAY